MTDESNESASEERKMPPGRLLLSPEELGELLGLGRTTIYRYKDSGRLPQPIKLGGSVKWRREEIKDWVRAGCPPRTRWEWDKEGQTG